MRMPGPAPSRRELPELRLPSPRSAPGAPGSQMGVAGLRGSRWLQPGLRLQVSGLRGPRQRRGNPRWRAGSSTPCWGALMAKTGSPGPMLGVPG